MKLVCYKARCGDSFHLQYVGESGKHRNIILDMGHSNTYQDILKEVILNLIEKSEQIDALFLSHIHNDHIGGANKFIRDIQANNIQNNVITRWIYNAPRWYNVDQIYDNQDGVLCGIVSADKVYEHILMNSPDSLCDITAGQSFGIDGMKVTILSPDKDKLNKLREKYSNNRPLCRFETDEAFVEAGSVSDDYNTPLNEFQLDYYQEDISVENASSIAAIFELNDKRILWLSDSVPSVIVSSLSQLGYCESNKMYCDCVLLSHHGSVANNSIELFKLIQADKYIISTDGINKYSLPNKETVARIVFSSISLPISIYFNYDDGRLSRMFKSDEPEKLKMMVDIHYLGDRQVIEV